MTHGTWQTTGGGGGGGLPAGLIGAAVLIAAMIGVAEAVAELAVWLLAAFAVVAVLLAAAVAFHAAARYRNPDREPRFRLVPRPVIIRPEPEPVRPAPERPALEQPAQQHIHFHGVSAADVAEILRRDWRPE